MDPLIAICSRRTELAPNWMKTFCCSTKQHHREISGILLFVMFVQSVFYSALQVKHSKSTRRHTGGKYCFSDLEDLLLQAVDPQRSLCEVQAHPVVPHTVHHVQVGLRAAAAHRHRDAEDVGIASTALCLETHTEDGKG